MDNKKNYLLQPQSVENCLCCVATAANTDQASGHNTQLQVKIKRTQPFSIWNVCDAGRKLEIFLKFQYINAHCISVLREASIKTINAHVLGGILLTHTYITYGLCTFV